MNEDNESIPMTDAGREFQTDGAAHKKTFREAGTSERLDGQ